MTIHICPADPARGHLEQLQQAAISGKAEFDWWNITRKAQPGDEVVFYMMAPTSAFVAAGTVGRMAEEKEVSLADRLHWDAGACFWISNVRMLPRPVSLAEAKHHLPEWTYLAHPKVTSIPNDATSPVIVEKFMQLLQSPSAEIQATTPTWSPPYFEIGQVYNRRTEIHGRFGGQQQGGISTPSKFPGVFLFTNPSGTKHGYEDGWDDQGVFLYTGEGQSGDMEFVRGNAAIRDHVSNGRDLYLFESQGKGEGYRYLGMFECGGWEFRRGPDTAGHDRRVIVFQLLPEGTSEPLDAALPNQTEHDAFPFEELRRRAYAAVRPVGELTTRETRRNFYERSTAVRSYVLARAAGVCEGCRRPAPFSRPDGTPYLEPHHTKRVADGGPDHPRWVGALCPNCHAEIHRGGNGPEVNRRLEDYIRSVEPEDVG